MKKYFIILLSLTLIQLVNGQSKHEKPDKDKIKALKIGFITEKLELSAEEAEKFWPVFNTYDKEKQSLREQVRKAGKKVTDKNEEMSDQELEAEMDKIIELREKDVALEKKYKTEFMSVLPTKKVAKIFMIEREFHKELLRKMRDKNGRGQGGHVNRSPQD